MKLYSENENYKLYQGNMLDMLEIIEPNSIDSIVTDPPYGLTSITKRFGKEGSAPASTKNNDGSFARLSKGFMGKEWDGSGVEYNIETWQKCYEVLKPGGYLLAFGGSRTFHRIACAIEDAGFEIRDTIMYLYGSGFPKSMNIGLAIDKKNGVESKIIGQRSGAIQKGSANWNGEDRKGGKGSGYKPIFVEKQATNEWQGWGTALKPSFEPIIVARKPFKGSLVDNVIENGVGGINIDECRVEFGKENDKRIGTSIVSNSNSTKSLFSGLKSKGFPMFDSKGRFPANTILTYDETDFDEVCGGFPESKGCRPHIIKSNVDKYDGWGSITKRNGELVGYADTNTSASRYFYCAKASKKDRDEGLNKEIEEYVLKDDTPKEIEHLILNSLTS